MRILTGLLVLFASATAAWSSTADFTVLGRKLVVVERTPGQAESRTVVVIGREGPSDVITFADPRGLGATLTVSLDGNAASSASYQLPASGWKALGRGSHSFGYHYSRATAGGTTAVKDVQLVRNQRGAVLIQAVLRGGPGVAAPAIAPPNPGTGGSLTLTIGTDRYCVVLGGAAGGTTRRNSAASFRIQDATSEPGCPAPSPAVCGDGIVQADTEECDGQAVDVCTADFIGTACQDPSGPHACQCCFPEGTIYSTLGDPFRDDRCCGSASAFPLNPSDRYCGQCLPDGYPTLGGGCSECCSGQCSTASGIEVCGIGVCLPAGLTCPNTALPRYFCCGQCVAGTCQ